MTKKIIREKILEAIEKDPYKKYIKKVSIFGSYAYGRPSKGSDVDVLIEFKPKSVIGYFELARIQRNMQKEVQKKIDLLTPEAISEFFRKDVLNKAEKIYGKRWNILKHILKASKRINSCLIKAKNGLLDDDDTTDILVRQLSVIGEASNNLSSEFKKKHKKEIPFRDIVSMRNFIVHEYFNVDKKRVWDTSINNIPDLRKKIHKILKTCNWKKFERRSRCPASHRKPH